MKNKNYNACSIKLKYSGLIYPKILTIVLLIGFGCFYCQANGVARAGKAVGKAISKYGDDGYKAGRNSPPHQRPKGIVNKIYSFFKCKKSQGNGRVHCYKCNGSGIMNHPMRDNYGYIYYIRQRCYVCDGSGKSICNKCYGKG